MHVCVEAHQCDWNTLTFTGVIDMRVEYHLQSFGYGLINQSF